jgi:hypothetical protein
MSTRLLFCASSILLLLGLHGCSYSNAFAFVTPRNHHHSVVQHQLKQNQLKFPQRHTHPSTRIYYSSDVENFNVTRSSDQQVEVKKKGKDCINRTADILAKRIVHRGVATMGQQLRLQHQQKLREQQQRELEQTQSRARGEQNKSKQQQDPTSTTASNSNSMSTEPSLQKYGRKYGPGAAGTTAGTTAGNAAGNAAPKSSHTVKANLELKWSIDKSSADCDVEGILSCSEPCTTCRGNGIMKCQFCHGHGYVDFGAQNPGTIGKRMERNNGGHTDIECPVCDENGEQGCRDCNGSGWIALWRKKDEDDDK